MKLEDVKVKGSALSPWAHMATVGKDGSLDVFDYDLDTFAPGGPDNSPGTGFVAITPQRAHWLDTYGMGGSGQWTAP